jgi:hypothetical protein
MPDVRSFNIEAFKAKFGSGAKSSLFYFQPQWPASISAPVSQQDAIYMVKSTAAPSTSTEEAVMNWQGFDFKYMSKRTYADFTVSFHVDLDAKIRQTFELWSNLIHDPLTNFYSTQDVYMTDQRLQMLGYNGQVIAEYTLHSAWPKEIGQITLDYATGETAEFEITFSYLYHTLSDKETGA